MPDADQAAALATAIATVILALAKLVIALRARGLQQSSDELVTAAAAERSTIG